MGRCRAPRWAHRLYALLFGYFWLPCPMCGRMFGGHETGGGTLWLTGTATSRSGRLVCDRHPRAYLDETYDGYITTEDVRSHVVSRARELEAVSPTRETGS